MLFHLVVPLLYFIFAAYLSPGDLTDYRSLSAIALPSSLPSPALFFFASASQVVPARSFDIVPSTFLDSKVLSLQVRGFLL